MAENSTEPTNPPDPNLHFNYSSLNSEIPNSSSLSLSLLSEPPDVRNWFSSYVYQSPVLDSKEVFDFYDTGNRENDEGNVGFEEETQSPEKTQSPTKCNLNSKGLVTPGPQMVSAKAVAMLCSLLPGSSYSLSLLSEPPDIRNWFSSYVYESPALDSEDKVKFYDTGNIESNEIVCSEEQCKSITKDCHWVTSKLIGEKIQAETLCDKPIENHDPTPIKDADDQSLNSGKSKQKLNLKLFLLENSAENKDRKEDHQVRRHWNEKVEMPFTESVNPCFSTGSSVQNQESRFSSTEILRKRKLESEVLTKVDSALSDADSKRVNRTPHSFGNNEENGKDYAENGFISTRSNRNASGNCRNVLKRSYQENEGKYTTKIDKALSPNEVQATTERTPRRPLSERTNNQCEVENSGVPGKWQCPQRSKPDLGPPTKQLRLDRWITRV